MPKNQCTSFEIDVTTDYLKGLKIGYNSTGVYWIFVNTFLLKTFRFGTEIRFLNNNLSNFQWYIQNSDTK